MILLVALCKLIIYPVIEYSFFMEKIMLTDLYVKNFKSIDMQNAIKLNEFSILCGSNSSGKSSLIQTILLLSQSFSSKYRDEPIILNGQLIRLGAFADIKNHKAKDNNISLSFTIPLKNNLYYKGDERIVKCELVIGLKEKIVSKEEEYHPLILSNKVIVSSKNNDGEYVDTDIIEVKLFERKGRFEYDVDLIQSSEYAKIATEYPDFEVLGINKGELIPKTFYLEYDYLKKVSGYIINYLIKGHDKSSRLDEKKAEELLKLPRCFIEEVINLIESEKKSLHDSIAIPKGLFESGIVNMFTDNDNLIYNLKTDIVNSTFLLGAHDFPEEFLLSDFVSLNEWKIFLRSLDSKKNKNLIELIDKHRSFLQNTWYNAMPASKEKAGYSSMIMYEVEDMLSFYFARSVKYLGPLRIEPQAVYSSLGHLDPNTVGLKGEFAAAVLHKNRNVSVNYLSPSLIDGKLEFTVKRKQLRIACQEWLSYLGVVQEFNTADRGKLGYELNVKINSDERMQDLTHVGVGVSQVLPIVIMALLSEVDDILIFEQPELHLHPLVQSRLCDLFIAMTVSSRQCIIETHSEYLINRLRLRMVQSDDVTLQDKVSLYFIEKKNGRSEFTSVKINKYGSIIDWPKDFFDQSDREIESILYEAGAKKRRERNLRRDDVSGY